ncbi:MAG: hypothetical protein AAB262_07290, partial [Elusimicrobiota bacterium]
MATNRYRKARKDILPSALRWLAFFLGALYLGWALLFPSLSGDWGRKLAGDLHGLLGYAALLLPL